MSRLLEAYIPWFARVQALANHPAGEPAEVAARLEAWFSAARSAAASANCAPEHAELAAFAAAAWADERLQTSDWEHAGRWHEYLLQRRHFGVQDAGEGFFRHLDELGPGHQEVREVFALALLLGLHGRHALDADDAAWRQARNMQLAQVLDRHCGPVTELLVGQRGRRTAGRSPAAWRRALRASWGVAAAATAAVLALFCGYVWLLQRAAGAWFPGA